jgi:hypothetical protein
MPMKLNRVQRIALGVATFWPPVWFVVFFVVIAATATIAATAGDGALGLPFAFFPLLFVGHAFTIVEMIALTVVYVIYAIKTPAIPEDQRLLWILVVLLGGFIGQAVCWFMVVRKDVPAEEIVPT